MTEDQLIVVDGRGRRLEASATDAQLRPTSELAMHLEVYRQRPDVQAVVHAHPPHLVAMSLLPGGLQAGLLPEAMIFVGLPPQLDYAQPSSSEGARAIRQAIRGHDALVLTRHGSLTVGSSLEQAFQRTETLEQLARICWLLQAAGAGDLRALRLGPERAAELLKLRERAGLARAADRVDFRREFGDAAFEDAP